MTILYMTENGVTDHIGRSQVAPYVLGLAQEGYQLHVLSAEKPGREALIEEYKRLFDAAGVRWTRVAYRNRPPVLGHALTQWLMKRAAVRIIRQDKVQLLHCRSFPPTLIAHRLKRLLGIKYIFDFRDFYADGGLKKRRGLAYLVFRTLKKRERPMICHADKVVCLTEKAKTVLSAWYLQDTLNAAERFKVIPCCADFALFDPSTVSSSDIARARERAGLSLGDFVLLYLGSLGPDYLLTEMITLFSQLLLVQPNARFLFVSNNGMDWVYDACRAQNVPLDRIHFVSVDRHDVPSFIALAHLSVVFIRPDVSKIGCSPTKIAELFACNIPVIANTGVGDLDAILDLKRNGSVVVDDFSCDTLRGAIEQVIAHQQMMLGSIRENSREFALEEGVSRYSAVYRELLNR
jgi:glycosyltransferase involved in cell wall biosynthesis